MPVIVYDGKRCDFEDCSMCEKCIFDVEDDEVKEKNIVDNLKEKENMSHPKNCNLCQHSKCQKASTTTYEVYNNWYCKYGNIDRVLNYGVPSSTLISTPTWCPLKAISCFGGTQTEVKSKLTYSDKYDLFKNMKSTIEWEDIKENEIYHVPPLADGKRRDIMVIKKSQYSFTYRELSKDPKSSTSAIYTLYHTSVMAKFLVKHKIKEFEVVNVN